MKKNSKAFTLIELLAIIVILAIIAVITVPIILNIIENSRKGAAIDSAHGYKDSINKWYVSELSNNRQLQLEGKYTVENGVLKGGNIEDTNIPVSGTIPSSGTLTYSNNTLTNGCLVIGEYAVTFDSGSVSKTEKGECLNNEYVPLIGDVLENIQSYDAVEIVYYNPVDGTTCSNYNEENSIPEYKGINPQGNQTECLKWYKYSTNNDGSINMILDHNIEVTKQYYTSQNNTYGPSNLMQYLTLSEWKSVPTRSDKYVAYKIEQDGTKTPKFTNATNNEVNYSDKKARLITAQEIAEITGVASTTSPGISWDEQNTSYSAFYLDGGTSLTKNSDTPSSYYWLFENLAGCANYGCSLTGDSSYTQLGNNVFDGNAGYWTSSPYSNNSRFAWYMRNDGLLNNIYVDDGTHFGIRPVITIPKK